jgi:hypothetical protein
LSFDRPPCKGRWFGDGVESMRGNQRGELEMMSALIRALAANEAAWAASALPRH